MKAFATAVLVAAAATAFAQQPNPSAASQQPATSSPQGTSSQQKTITGCLTAAQNVYTLTANETQPGASAATTVSYMLQTATDVDLKSHVNQKVEIKGTETAAQSSARVVDSTRSQAPTGTSGSANSGANAPATGASGSASANSGSSAGKTPTVETTAKAQIVAKAFSVSSVRTVAAQCDPIAK